MLLSSRNSGVWMRAAIVVVLAACVTVPLLMLR